MLRAIPGKALLWGFSVWEDGRPIGEADFGWFQGMGRLCLGDAVYEEDIPLVVKAFVIGVALNQWAENGGDDE